MARSRSRSGNPDLDAMGRALVLAGVAWGLDPDSTGYTKPALTAAAGVGLLFLSRRLNVPQMRELRDYRRQAIGEGDSASIIEGEFVDVTGRA